MAEHDLASFQPPLKRADAAANRARILEAAQAVFAERGLDLEIGEIAGRAGLGVGTLYRHFANREDLLRAIVVHSIHDSFKQLHTAVAFAGDDPQAALSAFISTGLRVQHQYGPLFAVIRDPRLNKMFDPLQLQAFQDKYFAIVLGILENGIQQRVLRSDLDRQIVAATLMGSLVTAHELLGRNWGLEELAQKLIRVHLAMLADVGNGAEAGS